MAESEKEHDARLEAEMRKIHEARSPFGRLMPDAAMKQAEQWIIANKQREAEKQEIEEQRRLQLKTPVVLMVNKRNISVDRLVCEQMLSTRFIDDEPIELVESILEHLERAGVIKIL